MVKAIINKLEVNALYYARCEDGVVAFKRPRTLEEFENQPEDYPYKVVQYGGEHRKVSVSYKENELVMAYVTPKEAIRHFHGSIRWYCDTAILVEGAV